MDVFPQIIMYAVIIGMGVLFTFYSSHKTKTYLRLLGNELESPQIQGFTSTRLIGKYKGTCIKIEITPGGRNSPPSIDVIWIAPTKFTINIYQEGFLTKMGKMTGFVEEIEIGIPDFDSEYVIETHNKDDVRKYLSDKEVRDCIEAIFSLGYKNFEVLKGAMKVQMSSYFLEDELKPFSMIRVFNLLQQLSQKM